MGNETSPFPDPMHRLVIVGEDFRIHAVANIAQTRPETMIGASALDFISPKYHRSFTRTLMRCLETQISQLTCYAVRAKPSICWSATFTPWVYEGQPSALISAHQLDCRMCQHLHADAFAREQRDGR